jgi:hypothetical protein
LNGEKLNFRVKVVAIKVTQEGRFLLDKSGSVKQPISTFSKWNDRFSRSDYFYPQPDSSYLGRWANLTIYDMYRIIYEDSVNFDAGIYGRIVTINNNRPFYQDWPVFGGDNWSRDKFMEENVFCYEVATPAGYPREKLKNYIIQDLDSHFKIKSRVEKRKIKCLALVQDDTTQFKAKQKNFKKGNEEYFANGSDTSSGDLIAHLAGQLDTSLMIVDDTKPKQQISFSIPSKYIKNKRTSIKDMRVHLQKSGFDLIEVEREMKVLVLENMR